MKLSDYLPEVPAMTQQMAELNSQINTLELMKASGDTASSPSFGLDHVVNTWVRHQMAYRQQLVMDIQTISMSVEEVRSPVSHITGEVFRRGIEWKAIGQDPDQEQRERVTGFLDNCNVFGQSLEEVLRQFHFDVNVVDDGFLYLVKEFYDDGKSVRSKVKEIRRLNPALVEYDLDMAGLPKNAHFVCPLHRESIADTPGQCKEPDCHIERWPVMYKYYHRSQHIYLFETEVIHLSKFFPSETYGWSPILTIFEKVLTLIGMDKNLYRYFFERKMPGSMMMVFTDDPESLRRERANIAAQTRIDPNFVPMVAVSAKNNRGRVDMVRLFHTLQEMDYLPVRAEIRERVAAMWGVTPAWQGAPEAFGGLSTQTQQLVVMSRVVEGDQRLFHEKVFPQILEAFGVTDWRLELPQPEERAEATRIQFAQQKIAIANQYANMGFEVILKNQEVPMEEAEFIISGEMVPAARMQGEQQALQLEQQQQQLDQVAEQGEPQEQFGAGGEMPSEEGGEEEEPGEEEMEALQAMLLKTIPKHKRKFKGRTGGRTPDWRDKLPHEERDIDEYAEARANKNVLTLMGDSQTWVQSLIQKGFNMPFIKQVSPDGKQMWFAQDNIDYVAQLNGTGVVNVEKAKPDPGVHGPFDPGYKDYAMYNPTGHHRQNPDNEEEENF
ncbi:hypothetical protein CMI37_23875 [Candidatus Pacearchaeota archaeon]|nr:hypothetical protein [Candidatus Pacearchaeota archaeon]|tara:strand:+ start:8361 stop:10358 length:1998 start_codon:yes stop_codon:yes gene_type:complete